MIPTVDAGVATTVIIVAFLLVAALLVAVLVGSTVRQQRRYLRTREHLGGRLLTAQDEERAAIARELHDDVVQRLVACATRLHSVEGSVAVAIEQEIVQVMNDLRGLARGIHPSIVDQLGLGTALSELSRSFADREDVRVEYVGPTDPDALEPKQRLALYRVAQEALGNVARHSGAQEATVTLVTDARHTKLVIEDRGRGFDRRSADSGPGIGVTSMRERLSLLGGKLDVDSAPGAGTRVIATLPASQAAS